MSLCHTWQAPPDHAPFNQVPEDLVGRNGRSHPIFGAPQAIPQLPKDPAELIAAHPFRLELPVELD